MDFSYQLRVALTDPRVVRSAIVGTALMTATHYLLGFEERLAPYLIGFVILLAANCVLSACSVHFLHGEIDQSYMRPSESLAIRLARYVISAAFILSYVATGARNQTPAAWVAWFCFYVAMFLIVDIAFRRRVR